MFIDYKLVKIIIEETKKMHITETRLQKNKHESYYRVRTLMFTIGM